MNKNDLSQYVRSLKRQDRKETWRTGIHGDTSIKEVRKVKNNISEGGNAGGRIVKLYMDDITMTNHVTRRSRIHVVFVTDEVNES